MRYHYILNVAEIILITAEPVPDVVDAVMTIWI